MINSQLLRAKLIVKKSPIAGYGVFAEQDFQPGDIIEECYTLLLKTKDKTLTNYIFGVNGQYALPLGYGGIYNHSAHPNAECYIDIEQSLTIFRAIKPIKFGDEIFIYYSKKWFDVRRIEIKNVSSEFKLNRVLSLLMTSVRFILVAGVLIGIVWLLRR